jgi:hypothetical protein
MTNLSPAAQAVKDAYGNELLRPGPSISGRHPLAAALQAAADQVVPANGSRKNNEIRAELLAIAAELGADND